MAKRYSEKERARLLEAYQNSGQTQKAFCQANHLSLATLGYWLRQARRDREGDRGAAQSSRPAIVEMAVDAPVCETVKIQLPSGVLIHCQPGQIAGILAQIDQPQGPQRS